MIGIKKIRNYFYGWQFSDYIIFAACLMAAFIAGIIVKGYQ